MFEGYRIKFNLLLSCLYLRITVIQSMTLLLYSYTVQTFFVSSVEIQFELELCVTPIFMKIHQQCKLGFVSVLVLC